MLFVIPNTHFDMSSHDDDRYSMLKVQRKKMMVKQKQKYEEQQEERTWKTCNRCYYEISLRFSYPRERKIKRKETTDFRYAVTVSHQVVDGIAMFSHSCHKFHHRTETHRKRERKSGVAF